ncbi:putative leucine-rich repeat receptor-like protein kinase [Heracleum sosnowskyi]|uniref:non-specific serine/threonine protein kinase n=1 Tax=Heracleum sosnowskyi TaxID=360622 RepID=A0AAD8MR10_9APIA|nr:putative leucine-rich repeat receptor-like protein kinase [Heracleum sosnowskyi]
MDQTIRTHLLVFLVHFLVIVAQYDDSTIMESIKNQWENTPPNWVDSDPCGRNWEGIVCTDSRVTSITLASTNLKGELVGDIVNLSELKILDLSYNKDLSRSLPSTIGNLKNLKNLILVGCGFTGPIPDSIGSMQELVYLSLNLNSFSGHIPASIGNLSKLYWLDLADNKLSGDIPVSSGSKPGLDMLVHAKHFHFGNNQLSGVIPPKLFSSNMSLIHVLFESNQLTGSIPSTLGLVSTLEVVRLDRNSLSGPIPSSISKLTTVNELHLCNNRLTGPLPDLSEMSYLTYLDLSNNSFTASDVPPWFTTVQSLTTLMMERTGLQGEVPVALFTAPQLQTVILRHNQLNGTLDLGTSYSSNLKLVDMQSNSISEIKQRPRHDNNIVLVDNPVCQESGETGSYCTAPEPNVQYTTQFIDCTPTTCQADKISSPKCQCAYPYMGTLYFRAPSFSDLGNVTMFESLQNTMLRVLQANQVPVDSILLKNPTKNLKDYLVLSLEVFPSGVDRFNRTGISRTGFMLSNQTFKPPHGFGPFFFDADVYKYFPGESSTDSKKSVSTGILIGAALGGSLILLLLIFAGVYAYRQKRRAERADKKNNPFASWDSSKTSGGVPPQLKGSRNFSYEELKKCTNNFSEANNIGSGGYGMVYRGLLPGGLLVAIKRATQGSSQGGLEFKTEIELLSRVHHKNVVSLVGFCFEQSEQMLIYEFIPNGTLKESLSGKSGIRLDWTRRLRIALGTARGLQYLHDLADPPIIHRDVKTNNILLDGNLNAKVADFGLSKLMGDTEKGHVTTQVKGTMGYLDPEYYMTQQLTEKSDVYSYGVVLLELLTAKSPIDKGKYIVREVKQVMDKTKDLYNLSEVIDPEIAFGHELKGVERFVELALNCVEEIGANRPDMSDIVKELESIMKFAGLNPNAESASTSASYEGIEKGDKNLYSNESLFTSGSHLSSNLEPK